MTESLTAKREQVVQLASSYASVKEAQTAAQTKLASSEELLQTLITGLAASRSTEDTNGGGYLGQISQAKKRVADAATEEEAARLRLVMVEKDLKEKDAKRKQLEKEGGDGEKALAKGRKELEDLRKKIEATGWNAEKEAEAGRQAKDAKEAAKALNEVNGRAHDDCARLNPALFDIGTLHIKARNRSFGLFVLGSCAQLRPKQSQGPRSIAHFFGRIPL